MSMSSMFKRIGSFSLKRSDSNIPPAPSPTSSAPPTFASISSDVSSSCCSSSDSDNDYQSGQIEVGDAPKSIFYVSSIFGESELAEEVEEESTSEPGEIDVLLWEESQQGGTNAANLRKQNITLQEENNALRLKNDVLMDMVVALKADLASRSKELESLANGGV